LEQHAELLSSNENPLQHYVRCGVSSGFSPTPLFDVTFYRAEYDIAREVDPFLHYVTEGVSRGLKPNSLFEPAYYVSELVRAGIEIDLKNALPHYIHTGAYDGFNPHPCFHSFYYLSRYKDVLEKRLNPLAHYLSVGYKEGRNPNSLFESKYYASVAPTESDLSGDHLSHYLIVGWRKSLSPSATFSVHSYRQSNPDYISDSKDPTQDFFEKYSLSRASFGNAHANEWYSPDAPEVSIIVLSYNNAFFTTDCLGSIWKNTSGRKFEVIVVDNGSTQFDLNYLQKLKGPFRLVPIGVNRGFGEGNNIGAELAKGKYLVFLNNDTIVKRSWLSPLVKVLENEPTVGCAGARLLYPDGRIQEAGSEILTDGTVKRFGLGQPATSPEFQQDRIVNYCSGAAIALRASDFRAVGGFDYRFDPAYYEDADLCVKLNGIGLNIRYCGRSEVIHNEHGSAKDKNLAPEIQSRIEINKRIFQQRRRQHCEGNAIRERKVSEANTSIDRTVDRVGLYTSYTLSSGGGENYLFTCGTILGGDSFTLVSNEPWSSLRVRNIAETFGIQLSECKVLRYAECEVRSKSFEIFFVLGNHVVPPVKPLGKKNIFICQFPFPHKREWTAEEKARLGEYDLCIVYSRFVRDHLLAELEKQEMKAIPIEILHPPIRAIARNNAAKQKMILNVGRFFSGEHEKKQLVLVETFKKLISDGLNGYELHLAGGVQPGPQHFAYFEKIQKAGEGFPVYLHPDISYEELFRLYQSASIYWHATGYGVSPETSPEKHEHFGMTTVEAMSAGCIPICINTAGQREIIRHGEDGFLWNDLNDLSSFTDLVTSKLRGAEIDELRQNAVVGAEKFSLSHFGRKLRILIGGA
jgi:GT2 family glycosyltransferase